ncbi:AraC family transcriptional regulator [Leeuwenhoekiella polynyae]|uniref:AraC family transcriptional regulator n=1 Tax=Leeuwenhoekiella polynyae TaxID=1550906 RepID=A0A4Q0P754_9FLAO|nr:AraC family transcriptional regulator [Leeuwenhoekiella polynyae]RXG22275.1 AraC family transcriptional regulator [Leeuwenhoekiella polynyae]
MKLIKLDRQSHDDCSFTISHTLDRHFLKIWHYHPELELVLILESTGTRFIGDSISKFNPGELVLLGPNLPHMWLNDPVYFKEENKELQAEAIAIHFKQNFLGTDFFSRPEMRIPARLLQAAQRGLVFENIPKEILHQLKNLKNLEPFERSLSLLQLLKELVTLEHNALTSAGYMSEAYNTGVGNFDKVYEYLYKNFRETISLDDVAALIPMNPSAFSRLFSKFHKKSLMRYLNEIRIGFACRLLMEPHERVSEIGFASGYNSLSNFNRQFKKVTGKTPKEYAEIHSKMP